MVHEEDFPAVDVLVVTCNEPIEVRGLTWLLDVALGYCVLGSWS
jgi:hypothetical protein